MNESKSSTAAASTSSTVNSLSVPSGQTHVVIVSTSVSGHRLSYVRLVADAALNAGALTTIIVAPTDFDSPEVAAHLDGLRSRVSATGYSHYGVKQLRLVAETHKSDLLVIPDADNILLDLAPGWRGRGRLSLLVMRETVQPGRNRIVAAVRQCVKSAAIRHLSKEPAISIRILKPSTWLGEEGQLYVRDPVEFRATAPTIAYLKYELRLTPTRYWFGVFGSITERKNLPLVLEALRGSGLSNVGILVAGRMDPVIALQVAKLKDAVERSGIAVRIVDRVLDDVELDSAIAAVDCLVLAHSNEGPSGVFAKGLVAGTRMAVAGASSLREESRAFPDNASWSTLSIRDLRNLLVHAASRPRPAPQLSAVGQLGEMLIGRVDRE